jgi:hypothetical protein
VHLPPGAVLQDSRLPALLTQLGEGIGATTGESDHWWTVPGQVDSVKTFVTGHPPDGLVNGGSSGGGAGAHPESTLDYNFPTGAKEPQTLVGVSFVQDGTHVDVRVQAQVAYLPTRTAIETIPASVSSAVVVYQGPTMLPNGVAPAKPRTATVTGAGLRALIDSLNPLDAEPDVVHSCPAPDGETATITMAYSGHHMVFAEVFGGCGGVQVTADGVPQPTLSLSDAVAAAVHTALHVTKAEDPFLDPAEK